MARSQRPLTGKKKQVKRPAGRPKVAAKAAVKSRPAAKAAPKSAARAKAGTAAPRPVIVRTPELEGRPERRRGPRSIEGVLARLSAAQTLEVAYHAWDELRLERALALERFAEDGRRLGEQAGFWVGAARAASEAEVARAAAGDAGDRLVTAPVLQRAAAEAEAKLRAAAAAIEAQAKAADAGFEAAEQFVKGEIRSRAQRYALSAKVRVRLVKHPAGASRTILHLDRVGEDDSVVLMLLLTGKLPTRYGFLFDDSTENVSRPPPCLYAEEGVTQDQTRPTPRWLSERLLAAEDFAPVKGFVPLFIKRGQDEQPVLHRLLQRGAVMEVEIASGEELRNVLTQEEAERVAGAFLRLKLDGRIELELGTG